MRTDAWFVEHPQAPKTVSVYDQEPNNDASTVQGGAGKMKAGTTMFFVGRCQLRVIRRMPIASP